MADGEKIFTVGELLSLDILGVFGLHEASEEEKQEFFKETSELILQRVVMRVQKELPEAKRERFLQLFEKPSADEERAKFLRDEVPELEAITLEEILTFKEEAMRIGSEVKRET